MSKQNQKRKIPKTTWLLIALVALGLTFGGVVAYLSTSTGAVTNTFAAESHTDPTIQNTLASNVASNVKVDVGDPGYAVYVRAAVVITWKDADGNVLAEVPEEGKDYTIVWNVDTDTNQDKPWFKHGSFYYHESIVNTNGSTEALIHSCTALSSKGEYTLSVEVIVQTIQALGTTDAENETYPKGKPAVTEAWGVEVDSYRNLTAPTTP